MIRYILPPKWIFYNWDKVSESLLHAKVAIQSLQNIPYQRDWVESLQELELKREVAGTSRIEGADFTENELDEAISGDPGSLRTISQKQVRSAVEAYRWIARSDDDQVIDADLILEIHRHIVTGCDDDHCPPGKLRAADENVTFGTPRHRGVAGGDKCEHAFNLFLEQIGTEFKDHDAIIQALAAHYHLAVLHPFLDGNGRTARALEALMLQRAGLKDTCFIAMSNYYYDKKTQYLATLSQVRADGYDLTPFLIFALEGVTLQTRRLMDQIRKQTQKLLFRDTMSYFSDRLLSPRKRAITARQSKILEIMLKNEKMDWVDLRKLVWHNYEGLKQPRKAFIRDMSGLLGLEALGWEEIEVAGVKRAIFHIDLDWPTKITETKFYKALTEYPKAKSSFPSIR